MKSIFTFIFSLAALSFFAQGDITPKVSESLRKGDAATISEYFTDPVEMIVVSDEGSFSRSESKALLARFFLEHPVKDFSVKHQGTSKLDDQYRIGDIVTSKGTFRVTFFMRKNGTTMSITLFKLESIDE